MQYRYQQETIELSKKLDPTKICGHDHLIGMEAGEPMIVMIDSMIRYAREHEKAQGDKLASDWRLLDHYKDILRALKDMLNWNGALSVKAGVRDSKDNSTLYKMIQVACQAAGINEEDL